VTTLLPLPPPSPGPVVATGVVPVCAQAGPGVALALRLPDRWRVAVLDRPEEGEPGPAELALLRARCGGTSLRESADALVGGRGEPPPCTSLVIADVWGDGRVDVVLRSAPPPLVLAPYRPARLLVTCADGPEPVREGLAPDEVLLLCSAAYLEDPPAALCTVRQGAPDRVGVERLRRDLSDVRRGAVVAVG
jgi:hypothetical protein